MAFDSEDEFLTTITDESESKGWSPESDYAAPDTLLLQMANEMGKGEAALVGIGKGMSAVGSGIQDAYYGLTGQDAKRDELSERIKSEQKMFDEGLGSKFSKNRGWASAGELGGQVIPGMAIPGGGQTMATRALIQALYGGVYEGLTNAGGLGDRLTDAVKGAAGAGFGSAGIETLGKGLSAASGKWADPALKSLNDKLVAMGLKPTIGDLASPTDASFIRTLEDLFHKTSTGVSKLTREAEALKRLVVPNKQTAENVVTGAVKGVDKKISQVSNDIWSGFEGAVQGNVTKVRPAGLKAGLDQLYSEYPQLFSQTGIPNQKVRERLLDLVNTPANKIQSIDVAEFNDLRKAIGGVLGDVKTMTTPAAAGSPARLERKALKMTAQLLDDTKADMARWGNNGKNQKAYKLFEEADNTWKTEVLPWKKNQLVADLKNVESAGAPETARLVAGEKDTDVVDQVRAYLKKYGDYDDSDVVDALATQKRAARTIGVDASGSIPTPNALVGLPTDRPFVKGMYFGDPKGVIPSALKGLGSPTTTAVKRALDHMRRTAPISASREIGDKELAAMLGVYELFGGSDKDTNQVESYSHGIGAATQQGTR